MAAREAPQIGEQDTLAFQKRRRGVAIIEGMRRGAFALSRRLAYPRLRRRVELLVLRLAQLWPRVAAAVRGTRAGRSRVCRRRTTIMLCGCFAAACVLRSLPKQGVDQTLGANGVPCGAQVILDHARANDRVRPQNELAQHTLRQKRQNNTTYSGFGGALAYGYGFRITRSAFGIVAVFGAQNSFCQFGVR